MSPVSVGVGNNVSETEEKNTTRFTQLLDECPNGLTPLCRHIQEIVTKIKPMVPQLMANGQKVAITILTDGEASDGNVVEAMRELANLPVWVVVRLCTNDEKIAKYWNDVDKQLGEYEVNVKYKLYKMRPNY